MFAEFLKKKFKCSSFFQNSQIFFFKSEKSPSRDSLTCHISFFFKLQKKWYLISSNQVILLNFFIILFGRVVFCSFKFHHVGFCFLICVFVVVHCYNEVVF